MPTVPPLPPELRSRILVLEGILFVGALILGAIVLYIGLDQVRGNVHAQLKAQQITFTPADKLTPQEKSWKRGSECLVANGGKLLTTGEQAKCYSDYYILLHMSEAAEAAGYPGATYATLGTEQSSLRAQIADAKAKNDTNAATAAQQKLDAVTTLRTTLQSGTSLRGQLLNAWGWDTLGLGVIVGGGVVLLLAVVFLAALLFELSRGPTPQG